MTKTPKFNVGDYVNIRGEETVDKVVGAYLDLSTNEYAYRLQDDEDLELWNERQLKKATRAEIKNWERVYGKI